MATVYVIDDEPLIRRGLERLLRSAGFAAQVFSSAQEFVERHDPGRGECMILDLEMPGLDGLQLQQALHERGSALPIVFLSGRADIPRSISAMKLGAVDFLTKPVRDEVLLAAVRRAIERHAQLLLQRQGLADIEQRLATLTPRERQVLPCVVAGLMNKQIAAQLGTGEKTIKIHRARIMRKMRTRSLVELVKLARRVGIMPGPTESGT